jgi:hypothetical protein
MCLHGKWPVQPKGRVKENGAWLESGKFRKMSGYKQSGQDTKGRGCRNRAESGAMQMVGMRKFLLRGKLTCCHRWQMQQVSLVMKNSVYPLNGQSSHPPYIPKIQIEQHSLTASTGSQDHFLCNCLYKQDNFSALVFSTEFWILTAVTTKRLLSPGTCHSVWWGLTNVLLKHWLMFTDTALYPRRQNILYTLQPWRRRWHVYQKCLYLPTRLLHHISQDRNPNNHHQLAEATSLKEVSNIW